MHKIIKKLLALLIMSVVLINTTALVSAQNGSFAIRCKSSSFEVGDSFRIVLEINAPASGVECFGPLEVSYNTSVFQFVRTGLLIDSDYEMQSNVSGGIVSMSWLDSSTTHPLPISGATYFVEVWFKAIKAGSGTFTVITADGFLDQDGSELFIDAGAEKTITVSAAVIKSDNNSLKTLEVSPGTLSPAFSAGTTSYGLSVGMDIDRVTVSATPADSKASVAVTGNTGLLYGENEIKVVVTAENGDKRTYTIIVNRAAPSPTPEPTPTPAVSVSQPNGIYTIEDPPDGTPVPGGFYTTLDTVGGQSVPAFRAIRGDLTLYYMNVEGGDAGFYYLDAATETYLPFLTLSLPAIAFPILAPDPSVSIPEGFTATTLDVSGETVSAWTSPNLATGQVLLYLMNNDGDKGFYVFDETSRLLSPYFAGGTTQPSETTDMSTTEPSATTDETTNPDGSAPGSWAILVIALGALCLVLIGVIIYLIIRGRGDGGEPPIKKQKPAIRRVD